MNCLVQGLLNLPALSDSKDPVVSPLTTRFVLLTAALVMCTSCLREYDFSQDQRELGTLGEEAHAILLKDAPRSSYEGAKKEAVLIAERDRFVTTLDTIAPQSELALLDALLQSTLVMIDSGLLPGLTRKTSKVSRAAANDTELLAAITDSTLPQPADFISPIAAPDLLGYVTTYPNLRELGIKGTRILLDNDGYSELGVLDPNESNGITELMRTLASSLEGIDPQQIGEPLAIIVRDMLLNEDPRFAPENATRPLYVSIYDARGLPLVNPDVQAQVFLDEDEDGSPDVDVNGDFVLRAGGVMPREAFGLMDGADRDGFGRSKVPGDDFAFSYIDLNETALSYLIREYAKLSEQGVVADLLATFRQIMGATVIQTDARGAYAGFSQDNPLMDLSWGLSRALSFQTLPELTAQSATFLEEGDSELAGVVVALEGSVEFAANHPDAELAPTNTLLNDLIPTLHAIASDELLWRDFMNALGDPITPRVGESMLTLMSYKNTKSTVAIDGFYDTCFQQCRDSHLIGTSARFDCIRACPTDEIFKQPMDYSLPESPENRSQLQATWHLMWSLAGVPYAMEMDEIKIGGNSMASPPPLIALPGGAEAFLSSVAGNLDLADAVPDETLNGGELGPLFAALGVGSDSVAGIVEVLSSLFGVTLSRKPTPDQLTRMFTQDDIAYREGEGDEAVIIDIREPRDIEGYKLSDNLADGLFEAEASGMIDAVYPMAKAFSDHGKEYLLLELFTVVHKHYPNDESLYLQANGSVSPSQAANLRSFEPVMRDVFEDGRLLESLFNLSTRLQQLEASSGLNLNEQLRLMVWHATRPGNFTTRDGLDYINLPDGRTQRNLSPLHVLVDALGRMAKAISADPEAEARFNRAVSALFDLVIGAEWPIGQKAEFKSQASVALSSSLLNYLADFTAEKRDAGQLEGWLQDDLYLTLEELWPSRLLVGLVMIAEQVLSVPENRATVDEFVAYLVGTPRGREHTSLMAYQIVIRSVNTTVWVPIARTLASLLDPDRDWQTQGAYAAMPLTSQGALALHELMLLDEAGTGIALMNRALFRTGDQRAPIFALIDIFTQYLRIDPGSVAALVPADYKFMLEQLADWLDDDAKGMEQMYDLVGLRAK